MNSIACILVCAATLSGCAFGGPSDPEPRPDQWWIDRHNSYVQNTYNNPNIPIVFFGDSITEGWGGDGRPVFDENYAPLGVANYGIGGDRTEHVIWRIQNGEVQGLSPKLVVLKIGTNNFGAASTAEIAQGIQTVVMELRMRLPNAKILLLGVLPRGDANAFAIVSDINIRIAELENGDTIRYLNMFDSFAISWGVVDPELFSTDTVHLRLAGYQKWNQVMDRLFQEMRQ